MNLLLKMLMLNAGIAYGAETEGAGGAGAGNGAGGDDGAPADKAALGNAGNESGDQGAGEGGKGEADGDEGADKAFVDDPAKTAEENAAARAEHEKAQASAAFLGAPEKYADIEVPEGFDLNQETVTALHALGKEANLSQAAIDRLVELQKAHIERSVAQQQEAWKAELKRWDEVSKADPEIGGAAFEENMGLAASARQTFGSTEFNKWLDESQLGSHPEFRRFLVGIGRAMGEGKTLPGGGKAAEADPASILYDNPTSKA